MVVSSVLKHGAGSISTWRPERGSESESPQSSGEDEGRGVLAMSHVDMTRNRAI